MNYKEFIGVFKKQVFALTHQMQLEFALSICKKLYFDYQKFYEVEKWGNPELLMDAIRLCENAQDADKPTVTAMIKKVEAVTPDTEDFGDYLGSYALNASVSILHTLTFLLNNDSMEIFWVGNAYYDTWDFRVQEDADLSEEEIDEHPLMQEAKKYLLGQTK